MSMKTERGTLTVTLVCSLFACVSLMDRVLWPLFQGLAE